LFHRGLVAVTTRRGAGSSAAIDVHDRAMTKFDEMVHGEPHSQGSGCS